MPTLILPTYPSEKDIRYGMWLKHFALYLPAYAQQYNLSIMQLLEVRCIAGEYLDLLIWRLQQTTANIVNGRQPPLAPADTQARAREAANQHERATAIQDEVVLLVVHLQQHPAYTAYDGQILQLDTSWVSLPD